ncbi:MAG: 5-dehydro-2-deoxygluconokinase [Actinomycetota bacterium]
MERSNHAGDAFDLLTMGRVGVDLYPEQIGVSLAEVKTFAKYLGGTATNVAVAGARYGHRTAVMTKVGLDGFGDYVRQALIGFGVDNRFVGSDPDLRTPIVFCEIHPPDHFPLLFYRQPKAPDLNLTVEELDLEAIRASRIFWTTGTGLSAEPSRLATLRALDARARSRHTIHDLDYRPSFWSDEAIAGDRQREALDRATIAIGNLEECAVAVGSGSPAAMGRRIIERGVEVAVVKMGREGVTAFGNGFEVSAPPLATEVVNGLGAGDAFGGAVCHGLLCGWGWDEIIPFANAAGAYVAGQLACADAMPTEEQVRRLM